VIEEIAETGSIAHLKWVPRRLRRIFKTAHDIDPEWHLVHQAAWQVWVDAAVSKTINLRHDEPPETVERVYKLAWKLHLKGITVYRDRSKSRQVIYFGIKKKEAKGREEREAADEKGEETGLAGEKPVLVIKPRLGENQTLSSTSIQSNTAATPSVKVQEEVVESVGKKENLHENRMTPRVTRVRLGKGRVRDLITVSAEYAGGCPTCDI
jgi:ribonucleotide reductase alpha subunit